LTFIKPGVIIVVPYCFAASLTDSELIETVREVKVVDIGASSFKLAWKKTPGVTGYKITWSPFHGGHQQSPLHSIIIAFHYNPSIIFTLLCIFS